MPGLVPGIHVFLNGESENEDVDGRDKPGHDDSVQLETALAARRRVSGRPPGKAVKGH
jgi:hypothetical protein